MTINLQMTILVRLEGTACIRVLGDYNYKFLSGFPASSPSLLLVCRITFSSRLIGSVKGEMTTYARRTSKWSSTKEMVSINNITKRCGTHTSILCARQKSMDCAQDIIAETRGRRRTNDPGGDDGRGICWGIKGVIMLTFFVKIDWE